jgi:hypothetical protein
MNPAGDNNYQVCKLLQTVVGQDHGLKVGQSLFQVFSYSPEILTITVNI